MKIVWIITIAICSVFKSKCPKECEVQIEHDHLVRVCKDSTIAFKEKANVIEFYKTHAGSVKRIDSVKVN